MKGHQSQRFFPKLPPTADGVRHLLVTTIDTEEEGRWAGEFRREGNTCRNVAWLRKLVPLQREYGLKFTFLVDYPVVTDSEAVETLLELVEPGGEIGAHLHPWCNPPYAEIDRSCTYAGRLPVELLRAKLQTLVFEIERRFGVLPRSYRAGRWGMSPSTLAVLEELGVWVDSSVIPLRWQDDDARAPNFLHAPPVPYFPDRSDVSRSGDSSVLEVPVPSVIMGFAGRLVERAASHVRPLPGLGRLLDLWGRTWLRPSSGEVADLRRATRECLLRGHPVLNVMFHSSELMPGASPYVRDERELETFMARLGAIVGEASGSDSVAPATLTEVRQRIVRSHT